MQVIHRPGDVAIDLMLELLVRQFVEQNKSETLVALTDFQQLVGDKESLTDLQRDEDVNSDDFDVNI